MNNIDNALEQMINAILDSPEYHAYDVQRNRVKQFPELKVKLDEFRQRNYELQTSDEADALEKLERLEKEYANFRENALVEKFLTAELAFCRLVQSINLRLTEAMHFE